MKTPIIVDENGPVYIFETLKDAELYLEPIDVSNNRYVAYDSEGRLLRLRPTEPRVTIESAESIPTHSSELRAALIGYLGYFGVDKDWLAQASLKEMVEKSVDYKTK
jgi:hypothetical protein